MTTFKATALGSVSAAALLVGSADVASARGEYRSGDFHNHTTCSDGSTSVETLVGTSLTYLDWFIMAGHSGNGARDCRFDDPTQTGLKLPPPYDTDPALVPERPVLWEDTIGEGGILGDVATTGRYNPACDDPATPEVESCREMWRWQALDEYTYPSTIAEGEAADKPAFVGVEWVVPGHEHASSAVISGQYPLPGNARAQSHFEYCFARNSDDTSGGFPANWNRDLPASEWSCEISAQANQELINRFDGQPEQGPADYNSTLGDDGINTDDTGDHVKSTAAMYWMQENHLGKSYAVAAHVERQGAFIPDDNEGYNVEHLRDWNNAAPDVSFGFESQPGHQAQYNRGSYHAGRPTAGLYTYGGTGCYAAAEAARPGHDFDGNPLDPAVDFVAGGRWPEIRDDMDPAKVTVCREGVRTMWDAMLSEGRRFFFFASSDWHNRGSFPFLDRRSTNDFLPGEYQKNYTWTPHRFSNSDPAQEIVDGLRSGNGFAVQGDLIDELEFEACVVKAVPETCATMGETLKVPYGRDVEIRVRMRDPREENYSPYSFPNPALLQVGIEEPMNEPTVKHVELITGVVSGLIHPVSDEYTNPLAPESTKIAAQFTADGDNRWITSGQRIRFEHTIEDVRTDMYVRMRGSNIPPATPSARDADGNPIRDDARDNISCDHPDCPTHVDGVFTADVEAWGDLWFYANPIFIEVDTSTAALRKRFSRRNR